MIHNQKVLSVKDCSISFPQLGTHAVRGLSFDLYRGKTLAVVGESGSGKSMTALAIMGLLPPKSVCSGTIMLKTGEEWKNMLSLTQSNLRRLRGKRIGMIFQEPMTALNPVQKIGAQISESVRIHQRIDAKRAKSLVLDWLKRVKLPEPESMFDRYPHELSGGQKQRVMIAMAMVNNPDILIADEPTTALDASVQGEIIGLMQHLQSEYGTAIFFITHDLALAASIADEVMVLRRGECIEYGTREQVLQHPAQAYTKALLQCRPQANSKTLRLPVVSDFEENHQYMPIPLPVHKPDYSTPLLELDSIKVYFFKRNGWLRKNTCVEAVKGVSLNLHPGETLGLVGESGSGKSTVGKAILGLVPLAGGAVRFSGHEVTATEKGTFRKAVQLVFQDPYASLDPLFLIEDIITEPLLIHSMYDSETRKAKARQLLQQVGLPEDALYKYPHEFSGGQRQRISIARALALEPRLLICDESVSALDISVQAQVLNLLKDLQHKLGLAYLFISHDLSVVHYMSDRIAVMERGAIVEEGDADQILFRPANTYTQKLVAAMPELKPSF